MLKKKRNKMNRSIQKNSISSTITFNIDNRLIRNVSWAPN